MPVDVELMFEEIKWIDPSVYRMFCRLKHRGMTGQQLKSEGETFSSLMYAMSSAYHLNELESSGEIEIYNDYDNEKVTIRRLTKYDSGVTEL